MTASEIIDNISKLESELFKKVCDNITSGLNREFEGLGDNLNDLRGELFNIDSSKVRDWIAVNYGDEIMTYQRISGYNSVYWLSDFLKDYCKYRVSKVA